MRAVSMALLLCAALFVGCASVHTVGTQQIDAVIDSGILDSDKPVTVEDKRLIRSALESARSDIVAAETAKVAADKKAESNAVWASRGKCGAGVLGGLLVILVVGVALKILGKIPFI